MRALIGGLQRQHEANRRPRRLRARQALLAGTIFEQTKSPLRYWFRAIYFFLASKGGLSALELKRHMGFQSESAS